MKLKNWVLWLCVVVLLAGEFFLFSANRQKDAALVQLRDWISSRIRASPR
jgi:cytochrome c-type biogenesis protein CcmH/NrfF